MFLLGTCVMRPSLNSVPSDLEFSSFVVCYNQCFCPIIVLFPLGAIVRTLFFARSQYIFFTLSSWGEVFSNVACSSYPKSLS